MLNDIKEKIKKNDVLKRNVLNILIHPVKTRPRLWLRLLQCFYMKRGKQSVIYHSVRKDIVPFNKFSLGNRSVIEDYSCINNAVGDLIIGNETRIGLHNTIIGPVTIGNNVNLAQSVVISGLNHNYEDISHMIDEQGVSTSPITISDNVWIGSNTTITAGVSIGRHCIIGAGSVVTKNIPDYSVAVGNPAQIIKQYNSVKKIWEK